MQTTQSQPKSKPNSTRLRPATFYVVKGSADIRWRVELPVRHLKAKLLTMREKDTRSFTDPDVPGKFKWEPTEEGAIYPEHEGTAVFTRPCMVRATHAAAMSAQGIRTLAEVDDNFLSPMNQNIFMRMQEFGSYARRQHLQAMTTFDGIIYSTEWLRDEYTRVFKKELRTAPPGFVARNHVDALDWERRVPVLGGDRPRIRVGWMGSHQHVWDLRLAAPALRLAKDLGCEIVFIGLDPAAHDPKWRDFLGGYTHVPWFSPNKYHKSFIDLDIGLIPLVMNKHTLGKSDVKFLEYAMSGVATVAQNIGVYNKTVIHGETGLLAGSPDEMAYAMADLVRNDQYRRQLVKAAKQYVLENRTIQKNLHEWSDPVNG